MALRPHERILHVAPLFHFAQLNLFLISGVALGATHIIHRDFHQGKTLQAIQEHKTTHFFGVPAMFNLVIAKEELKSFCRQKLAGYKAPRRIVIEEQLPRNASGKILKYQLRQKMNQMMLN